MTDGTPPPRPRGFDRARRWYYRNERRLVVVYLLVLVALNALPFAWSWADRTFQLEERLEQRARTGWPRAYMELRGKAAGEDVAAQIVRYERFLSQLGPRQLRALHGRLRVDAQIRLGRLYLQARRVDAALLLARQVVVLDPKDYRGHHLLGDALWAKGTRQEALRSFRRALEIQPVNKAIVKQLMRYHAGRGEHRRAFAVYQRYDQAVLAGEGSLVLTDRYPVFEMAARVVFPVTVDGRPHTYRIYPGGGLLRNGLMAFRPPRQVHGLRLGPVKLLGLEGVRVELTRLVITRGGLAFEPAKPPVLDVRSFQGWRPEGGLELQDFGVYRTRGEGIRDDQGLSLQRTLPDPASWGVIEVTMTLRKPSDPELETLARQARRNAPLPIGQASRGAFPEGAPQPKVEGRVGRRLRTKTPERYSIAVVGHTRSVRPDASPPINAALIAAAPRIANQDDLLVITGDVTHAGSRANWTRFDRLLREPAKVPVLVALGNHDLLVGGRGLYTALYGPSYHAWQVGRSQLLVLDTEARPGDLDPAQLAWLVRRLDAAAGDPSVAHVFVFLHRVAWFFGGRRTKRYAHVRKLANNTSRRAAGDGERFWGKVFPRLVSLARDKRVIVFAGDVGNDAPLIYDRLGGVELIASGLQGRDPLRSWWDHYLRVKVAKEAVELEVVSLRGVTWPRPDRLDLTFWRGTKRLTRDTLPKAKQ